MAATSIARLALVPMSSRLFSRSQRWLGRRAKDSDASKQAGVYSTSEVDVDPIPEEYLYFDPERDTHLYTPEEAELVQRALRVQQRHRERLAARANGEVNDDANEDEDDDDDGDIIDYYIEEDEDDGDNIDDDQDAETMSIFSRHSLNRQADGSYEDARETARHARPQASDYDWQRVAMTQSYDEARSALQTKLTMMHETLVNEGAEDIAVIDVSEKANFTDVMVVCSGRSTRKLGQLGEALQVCLQEFGERMVQQGRQSSAEFYLESFHQEQGWVTFDATDILVHIQLPEVRDYYDIERLWAFENPTLQTSMEEDIDNAANAEQLKESQKKLLRIIEN